MEGISRETLEDLLELSRIEFSPEDKKKEEKILGDLRRILDHVEELNEVDTESVTPASGGKSGQNAYRRDTAGNPVSGGEVAVQAFPDSKNGYLEVPAVLEHKKSRK